MTIPRTKIRISSIIIKLEKITEKPVVKVLLKDVIKLKPIFSANNRREIVEATHNAEDKITKLV
jgi:hypothetical protein